MNAYIKKEIFINIINMGSGISTNNIECPANYNKDKFNIILNLFRKLDKNNDSILEIDEVKEISKQHIENRIKLLDNESKRENKNTNDEIKKLKLRMQEKIDELNISNEHRQKIIKLNLDKYVDMGEIERCLALMDMISYDKRNIDFWKFFTYMKDKTNDIENLV